jgi:hypothetical protein
MLIEIAIWVHNVVQRVPIIIVVKHVENGALCYDDWSTLNQAKTHTTPVQVELTCILDVI